MDVSAHIKELTAKRGWSRYRLREESQLPASTLDNIFTKGVVPSVTTLESICNALGISLSQFFAEGDMVALTAEQRVLIEKWAALSPGQQQALLELMDQMR